MSKEIWVLGGSSGELLGTEFESPRLATTSSQTLEVTHGMVSSVTDQMTKLECLQKMIIHRTLMLTAANSESEFIPCLCYCLLQLTADAQIRWGEDQPFIFV